MPAETLISVVNRATTAASRIERPNAPGMSPTPCPPVPASKVSNQCSDEPIIGKLMPPCGPWKDST